MSDDRDDAEQRATRSTIVRHARCSCGQLSLTCRGEPARIAMCHCHACQRRTGSAFGVQAWYPTSDVRKDGGEERSFVRVGESGKRLTFRFCPECGSTVWWDTEARPGMMAVAVGAFADGGFPPPRFSVWDNRRHPWVVVPATARHSD